MIKLGSVVKHRESGQLGTVEYSSFGYSVHTYDYWEGQLVFGKTLALSAEELLDKYDIVELPDGYKIGEYGGVIETE